MSTPEQIKEAQWRGVDRALTLYGLDKTAGVLGTLGSALGRAGTGAAKAYQHGGGTMMQNAAKGAKAGWSGFQRAGGMQAAGKALGGAALAGGAAYGAGKAFGAGQQSNQPPKMAGISDFAAIAALPALGGAFKGVSHNHAEPVQGAARGVAGATGGALAGGVAGLGGSLALSHLLKPQVGDKSPIKALAALAPLLLGTVGGGVGGYNLATKKYDQPRQD